MNDREAALYRYLTMWADFTSAEAMAAIRSTIHSQTVCDGESTGSIESQMEQNENRRAA